MVRVHDGGGVGALVQQRLAAAVRPGDVVASYGPAEHELLLVDCDSRVSEQRSASLLASLQQVSPSAAVGLAWSPRDGRTSASCSNVPMRLYEGGGSDDETAPGEFSDGTMESLRRVVERIAGSSISVLIAGETGVGKGLLAKELHRKSPRVRGPFVALNCAEFSESLLEGELFGYEKGAFTGAEQAKAGLIETRGSGHVAPRRSGRVAIHHTGKVAASTRRPRGASHWKPSSKARRLAGRGVHQPRTSRPSRSEEAFGETCTFGSLASPL